MTICINVIFLSTRHMFAKYFVLLYFVGKKVCLIIPERHDASTVTVYNYIYIITSLFCS